MKILFNRNNSISTLCLLLLLAAVAGACVKDEYAEKEKATVQVTFTTRAISGNPNTTAGTLEEYEHMRTLRVIVARSSDNEILYNVKYDIAENETSKTITFSELTVNKGGENFVFYAIANEAGTGFNDWGSVLVKTLASINLENIGILNNGQTFIPQTAKATIKVTPQESGVQTATIPLQFAVAKVRLTINNTSTTEQTVSEIKLSGLNMASTPLFAGDPLSTEKTGELSLDGMTISAGGVATVYAYFYENQNTEGYQLTANWNGEGQELLLQTDFDGYKQTITKIPRGKMLDITIKLNADVDIEPTINVQVDEWTGKTINVPSFQ